MSTRNGIQRLNPRANRCQRKVRFADELTAAIEVSRMFVQTGHRLRLYPCPFCGGFHVGHSGEFKIQQQKESQ